MVLLTASGIGRVRGHKVVLNKVSLAVEVGEKLGLVGVNGSGKTTLARVLAGLEDPDEGEVVTNVGCSIEYLEQRPQLPPTSTAHEIVVGGMASWVDARRRYDELSGKMTAVGADVARLVVEQAQIAETIEQLGGWNVDHHADAVLENLGVTRRDEPVGAMSGGEQRRIALARLLVARPDFAILDEPTNHLDIGAIEWLEAYLRTVSGAVLLITHDRWLLDKVVDRTVEIDAGALHEYDGGWSAYLEAKALREEHQRRVDANRRNFLRSELEWLRTTPRARTTKQKARIDRAQAVLAEQPVARRAELTFSKQASRSGKTVVELDEVGLSVAGRWLVRGLTVALRPGDRVGVLGPNGCGKSTLLRTIAQQRPADAGEVRLGKVTRCAYLDQFRSGLDEAKSVVDDVGRGRTQINVGGRSIDLRSYLQMFAIEGEQLRKTVAELSGGERARVALAKLLSQEVNLMVLDEPTNDLDVVTLSAVESMLLEFGGTSIVVTHDRHFLDRVATSIWAFEGDRIGVYEGDYSRYRSRQGEATALAVVVPEVRPPAQPDKADRGGLTYGETRELRRLEQEIEDTERQIAELEQRLADPTGLQLEALRELSETFGERQLVLQTLIARWEHLEAKRG